MKVNNTCRELPVFGRRGRGILVLSRALRRVIERPMLHVALAALHHRASHSSVPALTISARDAFWKMKIRIWHDEFPADTIKAHFTISFFERERMRHWRFFAIKKPLIHAPEMGGLDVEIQRVYEPGNQGQLLRWPYRPTNPNRVVGSGLLPCGDVFQRLRQIEIFQRFIHHDLE